MKYEETMGTVNLELVVADRVAALNKGAAEFVGAIEDLDQLITNAGLELEVELGLKEQISTAAEDCVDALVRFSKGIAAQIDADDGGGRLAPLVVPGSEEDEGAEGGGVMIIKGDVG